MRAGSPGFYLSSIVWRDRSDVIQQNGRTLTDRRLDGLMVWQDKTGDKTKSNKTKREDKVRKDKMVR